MTGSFRAPIIIPIMVVPALGAWLAMVWYADAHRRWKAHSAAPALGVTAPLARADTSKQLARRDVTTVARSDEDAAVRGVPEVGRWAPSPPPRRAA